MHLVRRLYALNRDVRRHLRGHDLWLYAAGVTLYLALALLPLMLISIRLAALLVGTGTLQSLGRELADLLPRNLGVRAQADHLVVVGAHLPWTAALASLVPASFYGEGLRRAFSRFSRPGDSAETVLTGPVWRGRLLLLVFLAMSPLLLLLAFAVAAGVSNALGTGTGPRLLGIYLAFLTAWVLLTVLLLFAYRALAPTKPGLRALLWGAASTGSFIAGMMLGSLLILRLPLNLGRAYGGYLPVGAGAAVGAWLLLLHVIVLAGYVLTLRLDDRDGRVLAAPPVRRMQVVDRR